jgi:predicted nuclease of predicted toxin-antitoxin system
VKFKVDENLPVEAAEMLRQSGHDMDFADIRAYPPAEYPGTIVLRLGQQDKPHVLSVLTRLMRILHTEPLEGHLWIVEENRVRIRG